MFGFVGTARPSSVCEIGHDGGEVQMGGDRSFEASVPRELACRRVVLVGRTLRLVMSI